MAPETLLSCRQDYFSNLVGGISFVSVGQKRPFRVGQKVPIFVG